MAYTTQAAIESAIGVADLDALSNVDGATPADVVAAAIEEADKLIDSYARKRFPADQIAASRVIASLSARMAVRNLRRDRRMVLQADVTGDEADRKWLAALAAGLVTLDVDHIDGKSAELVIDKAGERDPTTKAVSRERLKGFW